ncbi:uncharacterized protein LAESUDRAFT_162230 [Laetiporus sulphureus 93-53]|uniref:Secreted protein n=1 Tax=Laetiporus sulphureus 93-53 TaxID=1314785 RepID=A0A165HPA8_9APHY|nr:uncharacterized protein LAESUDRAFT_162230 [Laetiporus sulphureus 93-53]KZT12002.1 hypothetical protein LAESUDRAFT_162230 [Laetiporus sulphureus 93-53]
MLRIPLAHHGIGRHPRWLLLCSHVLLHVWPAWLRDHNEAERRTCLPARTSLESLFTEVVKLLLRRRIPWKSCYESQSSPNAEDAYHCTRATSVRVVRIHEI